jgi:RHS repeat-associated protein
MGIPALSEMTLHDVHGNILRMPHLGSGGAGPNMTWDFRDQLHQIDLGGGGNAFYVCDASGERIRKVVVRNNGNLIEERLVLGGFEIFRRHSGQIDGNSIRLERETLHVGTHTERSALVEMLTLDTANNDPAPRLQIRTQLGNHLGSCSLELDEFSRIISYEEYAPYGSSTYQAVRSQTDTGKRFRYTGKERDEESGLYYFGNRYYAAWTGRWSSADPIGIADSLNLYVYTQCNPLIHIDPDGTFTKKTYDDYLDAEIKSATKSVASKEQALEASKGKVQTNQARLKQIAADTTTLEGQRSSVKQERDPLEKKKTKRTDAENKRLNELKRENTRIVNALNELSAEKGRLDSEIKRLEEKIPLQAKSLKDAQTKLNDLKNLKQQFDSAFAKAVNGKDQSDVEILTDVVMNEANASSKLAKKAIAYAYTNNPKGKAGSHVALPPKPERNKPGFISHFWDTTDSAGQPNPTEDNFNDDPNKPGFIGRIIDALDVVDSRLSDPRNNNDPTSGAVNWVSPGVPIMVEKYGPSGLPSWTKGMHKVVVPGIPAGEFTFFR